MSEVTSDTEQLIKDFVTITNEQDYSRISDVVAESFVWETPAADGKVSGSDGVQEVVEKIIEGFPDFEAEITDMVTSGDTGMAELRFTMTHEGEFEGIPPTGREVELRGMSKWRVQDGKLQELRDCANMQELLEQLGVTDA